MPYPIPKSRIAKAATGFLIALAILVTIGVLQWWTLHQLIENDRQVTHTNEVLTDLAATFFSFRDAEASIRGYVVLGQEGAPGLRSEAFASALHHLRRVGQLTSDNPRQQRRVAALEPLIAARFAAFRRAGELEKEKGISAAREFILTREQWQTADDIRRLIREMEDDERSLLKERSNLAEASERRTVWVTFSGSLAAFGLIIVAGIAIRNDTRERERVEEELRQSEARFRLLVERVGDYAIFMVDPAGLVASWNAGAERIKGYRENEILGRHFSCFYSGEDQDAGKPQMELRVAASEGGFEDEGWRIRKDGSRFWANVVITALRDPHERLLGFSKITRDLTDRRKIEEDVRKLNLELQARNAELARSNADLQQFAYVASHDLQEPLRMVISYLQILTEQYKGKLGADADEFIGYAVDGGYRMRQLITDLLEYSRVGTSDEKPVPTECGAVLEEVRANLDLAIRESSAVITCDPDPLPIVVADPSQMLQLFQNLIGNAIKFRGTRVPRISVSARRDGRHWLFSVADNGIGIEPEHQESIFLIFRRLHGRMEYPGTGIGLAICKKIVDQLGGRIWVESEPGKGSTFFFTVAAIAEDEAALEEARDGERN